MMLTFFVPTHAFIYMRTEKSATIADSTISLFPNHANHSNFCITKGALNDFHFLYQDDLDILIYIFERNESDPYRPESLHRSISNRKKTTILLFWVS